MSLEQVPEQTGSASPDPDAAGDVVRGEVVRGEGDEAVLLGRIDAERAELGRTVEELSARLDWKAQLRRRVTQTTEGVVATASRLWQEPRRLLREPGRLWQEPKRLWRKLRRGT
jgi:hypothetical protein